MDGPSSDELVMYVLSDEGVAKLSSDQECQRLGGTFVVHRYPTGGHDGDACECGQTRRGADRE